MVSIQSLQGASGFDHAWDEHVEVALRLRRSLPALLAQVTLHDPAQEDAGLDALAPGRRAGTNHRAKP